MATAVCIGDEAHAAAWRLVGVDTRVAAAETDIGRLLEEFDVEARLVLLSEAVAARLPAATLERARRVLTPLLVVLPGDEALAAGSELAHRVRRQLGMEQ